MVLVTVELALPPGLTVAEDHRASVEESVDLDRGLMPARAVPVVALVVLGPGPTLEVVDSVEVPDHGRVLVKDLVVLASLRAPDLGLALEKGQVAATEAALIRGLAQGMVVVLVALAKPLEAEEELLDPGTKPEELASEKLAAVVVVRHGLRMVASVLVEKEVDGTSLRDPSSAEVSEVLVEKLIAGTFHKGQNFQVALIPGIKVL